MEYFIFLITIQLPFLFLIWKFFQSYEARMAKNIRQLKTQQNRITHIVDTLRLSIEKYADDTYHRVREVESKQKLIESRLHQIEKYTGLRYQQPSAESDSVQGLMSKDFL